MSRDKVQHIGGVARDERGADPVDPREGVGPLGREAAIASSVRLWATV